MDNTEDGTSSSALKPEPGSFRDRQNQIVYLNDDVYRLIDPEALADWETLSATTFYAELLRLEKIVDTRPIDDPSELSRHLIGDRWAAVLQHQRIPFVSYPYEWSFGMLRDAGLLTLEILEQALEAGMILKDASSFNVQWTGSNPAFIDIPSIQRHQHGEPWSGYRQFCEMFLNPLFLQAYKDVGFHSWLRGSLDGIPVEELAKLMSARDLIRTGITKHVYLQSKLQSGYADTSSDVKSELRDSGFNTELIKNNVRGMSRLLRRLDWGSSRSQWSDYTLQHSYEDRDYQRKIEFVRDACSRRRRSLVWDLGANTGTFSRIAAESAEYVIAMDSDHLAVEQMYQSLKHEGSRTILPLVANIVNPSPGLGWNLKERMPLQDRGTPELTLALALIHHVVIGANVPLKSFVEWLADLGTDLVIEFVTREDPMVQKLLRNQRDIYSDYDLDNFEECLSGSFTVTHHERLNSGTRILYYAESPARKRNG